MKKGSKWKVQFLVMAFCVFGLVAVLVGSSYAIFSDVSDQGDYNTVTTGTLQLSYEDTQSLSLSNLYPVSDVEGMTGEGYTFTVRNIGTLPSDYKVMIQDDEAMIQADGCSDHLMPKANIKISIDGGTPFLLSSIEESNYMITTGNLQPGDSVTHVVKVWIDEASGNEILGTHFHGKVVVEGVQGEFVYQDESGANKEIYQNKSSEYITGMSNGTPSTDTVNTQVTYDTPDTGYGASSTGTIYGIYDMSGGSYDLVMGVFADSNGQPVSGMDDYFNSGFKGPFVTTNDNYSAGVDFPEAKYYDLYTGEDATTACGGGICYGHALSETAGWYQDAQIIGEYFPWFFRSGRVDESVVDGIFAFGGHPGGAADSSTAVRAVLVLP